MFPTPRSPSRMSFTAFETYTHWRTARQSDPTPKPSSAFRTSGWFQRFECYGGCSGAWGFYIKPEPAEPERELFHTVID